MSFVENYMTFAGGNEAPENYHLWTCISVLGSVVSRRVWINQGYFKVYPNLYVVLLGPPGNGKTTAMSIGKKFIREIGDIPFSAECQTKESLVMNMKEYERVFDWEDKPHLYTPVSIFITELSQFLGFNSAHMIDFLTTIYDQDFYDAKYRNKGEFTINGPYVNMLACTTSDWVTNYLKTDVITGGFSRRAIFVNEVEGVKRIPFPTVSESMEQAWQAAYTYAQSIREVCGEFVWTSDARDWFEDWYKNRVLPDDLTIRWFHKTKHVQMLKVAMVVALSESPTLELTKEHLLTAKAIIERIEPNLTKVFAGMGRNELHAIGAKLVEHIRTFGGIMPEKTLQRIMGADVQRNEYLEICTHLQNVDVISVLNQDTVVNGKKVSRRMVALREVALALSAKSASQPSVQPPDESTSGSST